MMNKEAVLVLLKPDVLEKGLIGYVLDQFLREDIDLIGIKIFKVSKHLAQEHYRHLKDQPFFADIVDYLQGSYHSRQKVIALVFYGPKAIALCRRIAGATNPEDAHPRTIRGAVGRLTTKGLYENIVHVSSDKKEARREISLWFSPEEIGKDIYPTTIEIMRAYKKRVWK